MGCIAIAVKQELFKMVCKGIDVAVCGISEKLNSKLCDNLLFSEVSLKNSNSVRTHCAHRLR